MIRTHRNTHILLQQLQKSEQFQRIVNQDGNAQDLSTLDLAKASPDDIKGLIAEFKDKGYDLDEQGVIRLFQHLTDKNLVQGDTYRSYDFASGDVNEIRFEAPGESTELQSLSEKGYLSGVQRSLAETEDRAERRLPHAKSQNPADKSLLDVVSGYEYTETVNIIAHVADSAPDALAARQKLRTEFGFKVREGPSLQEIARIKDSIPKGKVPEFIETFMTAFYVHSGGVDWDRTLFDKYGTEAVLFGNPPPLDQMPDGRYLNDCEGYAKIAEVLLDTLIPHQNEPGNSVYALPVGMKDHQLATLRIDNQAYLVDNNRVLPLNLSAEEMNQLQSHYDAKFSSLTGGVFGYAEKELYQNFDQDVLPSLHTYAEDHYPRIYHKNQGKLMFNEKYFLKPVE